jgi:hypothetical protein
MHIPLGMLMVSVSVTHPNSVIFYHLQSPRIFDDITYVAKPMFDLAFGSAVLRSVLFVHLNFIE